MSDRTDRVGRAARTTFMLLPSLTACSLDDVNAPGRAPRGTVTCSDCGSGAVNRGSGFEPVRLRLGRPAKRIELRA